MSASDVFTTIFSDCTNETVCKVQTVYATHYHHICYLLCICYNVINQHPDIDITGFHFYLKFIRMINRNSIYFLSH